jgi:hypothetical protein
MMFQALIVGSVFLKTPDTTAAFFSRGGVMYLYVCAFKAQKISADNKSAHYCPVV